ncbi:MAG: integrase/recombinase XerD [Candidatus Atribacteria bacterium]|nr:integrase/recombinase XerD [Candidatus Atribacteria bacterium]
MNYKENDFIKAFTQYLEAERGYSSHTVENYRRVIEQFALFLQGKKKSLLEATPEEISSFLVHLKVQNGLSRVSQQNRLSALRTFYRFLKKRELLSFNPAQEVGGIKTEKKLPAFLTLSEIDKLLSFLKKRYFENKCFLNARNWAIFELFYASGLRVSELADLKRENVDLHNRLVRVHGKGKRERIVPFNESARQALQEYEVFRGLLEDKEGYFFVNRRGGKLSTRGIRKIFERVLKETGILEKKVSPHTLRHTFATHFLAGGGELRVVQEMLGHASLSTTQIYTHIDWERMRRVYDLTHPHSGRRGN